MVEMSTDQDGAAAACKCAVQAIGPFDLGKRLNAPLLLHQVTVARKRRFRGSKWRSKILPLDGGKLRQAQVDIASRDANVASGRTRAMPIVRPMRSCHE
jgi:hypothetical protein